MKALLAIFLATSILGLSVQDKSGDPKYKVSPTIDKKSGTGFYIPKDLEDCFKELDKMLTPAFRKDFKTGSEERTNGYHMGLGTWLRNNWGLWKGLRLGKWFNKQGIFHPDDMSGIILTSYWRKLNRKPIELKTQVKEYQDYWKKANEDQKKAELKEKETIKALPKLMLGLNYFSTPPDQVEFERSEKSLSLRSRYAAPFRHGVLITVKEFDPTVKGSRDDFKVRTYFVDPQKETIHSVKVQGIDDLRDTVVVGDKAYFHGLNAGRDTIVELSPNSRKNIPIPNRSWLRLGISYDASSKPTAIIAPVGNHICRWNGERWEPVLTTGEYPTGSLPPELRNGSVYFRSEGYGEGNKWLGWLSQERLNKLQTFEEDTNLVDRMGPRWENVFSHVFTAKGDMWVSCGGSITPASLLRKRSGKYGVAIFNHSLKAGADLLRYSGPGPEIKITALEVQTDGTLLGVGEDGAYSITSDSITKLFEFLERPLDWTPTTLLTFTKDQILIGGHFGDIYLLKKNASGSWIGVQVDRKLGEPVAF